MATSTATLRQSATVTASTSPRDTIWTRLLATEQNWPLFLVRSTLAIVIFPHGAQKLLGWFGGYGFAGTMGFFTEGLGIPYVFGLLAIVAEFFGAIALATGFFGRVASFGIGMVMIVAAATSHMANGFFMNWTGNQAGEGFEYHLLALGMSVAVMVGGSGALSLDRLLSRKS